MAQPSWFQRFLLPGFAFKAVVIGGGYATGRELAEFFVSVGPRGGLLAMALSTALFSLICVVTFLFARMHGSTDYRNFFRNLVGPFWVLYEAAYMFSFVLILAVYGAAAGRNRLHSSRVRPRVTIPQIFPTSTALRVVPSFPAGFATGAIRSRAAAGSRRLSAIQSAL